MRGGYIDKVTAGVYNYLPLGLRVLKKIEGIVREEMENIGSVELLMPTLHPKELWETTGRFATEESIYKTKDGSDREYVLGPTHEEVVVPLVSHFVDSYKDLPISVFQFQNKFRMELRAKSGLLRGREFPMKDCYSFHTSEEDLDRYYELAALSYSRIYERVGLGDITYKTFAAGGSFSKYSHEYQTLTSAGEDVIFVCDKCKVAVNKEIRAEQQYCPVCGGENSREEKAIEVGNIFKLGTRFTAPFKFEVKSSEGTMIPVVMGCYGIGITRLMGTIVEVKNDEKGIIWPENIAPFRVHIIMLRGDGVSEYANILEKKLEAIGVDVLVDDRDVSAGQKFAESDLLGIPHRVVISEKTLSAKCYEYKQRTKDTSELVSEEDLLKKFSASN